MDDNDLHYNNYYFKEWRSLWFLESKVDVPVMKCQTEA